MRSRGLVALVVALVTVPALAAGVGAARTALAARATKTTRAAQTDGAAARAAHARVRVMPAVGSRGTPFSVRFRAPAATGRVGTASVATWSARRARCGAGVTPTPARTCRRRGAGRRVKVLLVPAAGGWCRGAYRGRIDEFFSPVCAAGRLCPEFVAVLRHIGSFRFRVR